MNLPWRQSLSEFLGTAALNAVGLSVVIFDFGARSPMLEWAPSAAVRRLITGFLFGTVGACIAISPVGKVSGAHINPAVTLAFWARGKMRAIDSAFYVLAQLAGGLGGAALLLAWGAMGRSVRFAATTPGTGYTTAQAFAGESATTFAMVFLLFFFIGHRRLRGWTPLLFPFLYAVMVCLEAPVSGTSTNPARTFGPSVISGVWAAWWVYWAGPVGGALAATAAHRFTWLRRFEIKVAKVYHFEHDPHGFFRRWSKTRMDHE
jgi:aquaporin Z